jgi:hypothetical protein
MAKIDVRLRIGVLVGASLRAGTIFNIINDINRMDRQGETVSKVEIYPRSWHDVVDFREF